MGVGASKRMGGFSEDGGEGKGGGRGGEVDDFRFVNMFKSVAASSVHCPSAAGDVEIDGQLKHVDLSDAQLKVVKNHLQKDVDQWEKHAL